MEKIVKIEPLKDFKLHLWFQDGVNGIVDLSEYKDAEIFSEWKDGESFAKVFLDSGAPTWPGGGDLDPFVLYLKIIDRTYEEYRAFKRLDRVA